MENDKQLVFIENDRVVTDSLTIAEAFKKNHKEVLRDIRTQVEKLDEANEQEFSQRNFALSNYKNDRGREYEKYLLTEDAFALVTMAYITVEAMKFKIKYINEFKRMREQLNKLSIKSDSYMIDDPITRAERWIEEQKEKQLLLQENEVLKPKAAVHDKIVDAYNLVSVNKIGKNIGIGEKKIFEFLRSTGIFYREGKDNLPKQSYQNSGYFEVKLRTTEDSYGNTYTNYTTKVTGKGEIFILNLVDDYGGAKKINCLKLEQIKEYIANKKLELKH